MYGCESWTVKKAECRRIDAFELWCWKRLLRVPWTARRSNNSILKEINPEYSLEGLMLKLKLQYFSHLMRRADSLEKTLMLGKFSSVQLLSRVWLFVPHELQHTRLTCPSPKPGACSDSCPLSQWCHPTISSPVFPFSSCLQSCSFQWVSSLHQMAKVLEFQLQHQSFQWIFRTDFL